MKYLYMKLIITAFLLLSNIVATASEGVVIAHVDSYSNFASHEDTVKELRLLYLKRKMHWPNGKRAKPYTLPIGHNIEAAFASKILMLTPSQADLHWRRARQIDGATPPIKVRNERLLSTMVSKVPHSFGIISKEYWTRISKSNNSLRLLLEF